MATRPTTCPLGVVLAVPVSRHPLQVVVVVKHITACSTVKPHNICLLLGAVRKVCEEVRVCGEDIILCMDFVKTNGCKGVGDRDEPGPFLIGGVGIITVVAHSIA